MSTDHSVCLMCGRDLLSSSAPGALYCEECAELPRAEHRRRQKAVYKELYGMFMRELARFAEEEHDAE